MPALLIAADSNEGDIVVLSPVWACEISQVLKQLFDRFVTNVECRQLSFETWETVHLPHCIPGFYQTIGVEQKGVSSLCTAPELIGQNKGLSKRDSVANKRLHIIHMHGV